jgi:hypothetical protein
MYSSMFFCLVKLFFIAEHLYFEFELSPDDSNCLKDTITRAELCATESEIRTQCPEVRLFFLLQKIVYEKTFSKVFFFRFM